MNKERILERIKLLEKERANTFAVYDGAIRDCEYWLSELDKEEKKEETDNG